jgi:hypothetical protein
MDEESEMMGMDQQDMSPGMDDDMGDMDPMDYGGMDPYGDEGMGGDGYGDEMDGYGDKGMVRFTFLIQTASSKRYMFSIV